jgi:hypothetical protein
MSTRLQISIDAVNSLPFDELLNFSNSHTQAAVLSRLSPGRREALIQEVEEAIKNLETRICGVGYEAASPRVYMGGAYVDPYSQLKKYVYVYTVLTGWMTDADLKVREEGVTSLLPHR